MLLTDEATSWSEREAQMRVLLDAKGHKIEDLQCTLSDLKESSEREIRIIKHQLLMMTGLLYMLYVLTGLIVGAVSSAVCKMVCM